MLCLEMCEEPGREALQRALTQLQALNLSIVSASCCNEQQTKGYPNKNSLIGKQCCKRRMESLRCRCVLSY